MSGRDIDGAYMTSGLRRHHVTSRRRQLRLAGLCINGPLEQGKPGRRAGVVHGPANPDSGKCNHCEATARRSR